MKIAIDVSPLESGHKVRGVGFYLKHLQEALLKYFPDNSYTFFTRREEIPQDIDVIHYPYFDPFFLTLPFKNHARTVVTVHDLTPLVFPKYFPVGLKGKLNWEIQKRALRRVDAVITDSECSKRDVIRYTGILDRNVTSVPLAAGEEFQRHKTKDIRHKIIEKYDLTEKFVLYVGDVTPNKNLPRLIEAVKKTDIPLVMVGKALSERNYDKSHPWNRDLLSVHRLTEGERNIHILGFVPTDDLVSLYNIASVFVMPSLYEGFGLPVLEAMSCGTPVITSKEGSLQEVAGDAAFYIDAYSVESIREGLLKVTKDEKIREDLRERGMNQAKKFSWRKAAQETLAVYEKVYRTSKK